METGTEKKRPPVLEPSISPTKTHRLSQSKAHLVSCSRSSVGIAGIVLGIGVCAYEKWYVPRTPIRWTPYSAAALKRCRESGQTVLIVSDDDFQWNHADHTADQRLDSPELRGAVHRYHICPMLHLHAYSDDSWKQWAEIVQLTGRDHLCLPCAVVVPPEPRRDVLVMEDDGNFDFADDLISSLESIRG